ncbi:pyroglutamyl-peptidase I family protein [Demequina subtropica]|uniref:pyroglutamyl-peptidase I family protein n=1 Tax=Demequina subtropica TaxID=1638989 RepID=UPI0007820AEF|nr:hypothetical protein [Demequina subtropica]
MSRVLITAFEPLPSIVGDGAADASRILAETWQGSAEIVARDLIPAYTESSRRLRASVAKHLPDAVLVVATDPEATTITVERLAVNLDDAPFPDAHGAQPIDSPVVAGAPAGLWTTLPAREIVEALVARGLPARLSVNAGGGLANHVFYVLQRELAEWGVPSGLVRVPPTAPTAAGALALPVEVLAEALRTVVQTVLGEAPPEEEPAPEPELEPAFDPEATQPFLMAIQEPIAEAPAAPPRMVTPTLAPLADEPPAAPPAPEPSLPPAAGRPEEPPVLVPPWGPTSSDVPVYEPPVPAPTRETRPDTAARPDVDADPQDEPTRHPTWDEIISGKTTD